MIDPMCGSGTSCVVANLLKRDYLGIDIRKSIAIYLNIELN